AYGRGGTRATVTDANVVLSRLPVDTPLAGGVSLDAGAAERAVGALASELDLDPLACAEGIVRVAETEMRRALAVMTVERGIDPRRFALMPFGGAGPLHAAAMAAELGIRRVLCPRSSGVLSALGLAAAAPRRDASSTVMLAGTTLTNESIVRELTSLIALAAGELDEPPTHVGVRYELRYRGQSFELTVRDEKPDPDRLRESFERTHEQRYGYRDENAEVELVTIRVSVLGRRPALRLVGAAPRRPVNDPTVTSVRWSGEWMETRLWRGELPACTRVEGPALCAMEDSTLLVPPGWGGVVDEHGTVVLERAR
ncbi:MAG: hydantoinase/oxoprolinase family protein, partial [Solirubrobacteraceae bacterium]